MQSHYWFQTLLARFQSSRSILTVETVLKNARKGVTVRVFVDNGEHESHGKIGDNRTDVAVVGVSIYQHSL